MDKVIARRIRKDLSRAVRKIGPLEQSPVARDRMRARRLESRLKKAERITRSVARLKA
jgi:hypothetical protein